MSAPKYKVDLGDLFTGPMDLLLFLVRRHEVDAVELQLATITRQFAEFVEVLQFLDLDSVGEFVVTAATLMEMKSRLVLPTEEETEDETAEAPTENAPQSELIQRLLLYRRYKEAADELDTRADEWRERYPRLEDDRPGRGRNPATDRIRDVELWDLVSALGRILRTKEVAKEGHIRHDDTPIHVYVERIGNRVRQEGRCSFSEFFAGENDRHRIVGVFLAILELVRHHGFRAEQPEDYGEIWVLPPLGEALPESHTVT